MLHSAIKRSLKNILGKFNVSVTSCDTFQSLIESNKEIGQALVECNQKLSTCSSAAQDIEFLLRVCDRQVPNVLRDIKSYKSQIRQDLFVLSELDFIRNGYFVDFGATDGLRFSNTCILEKEYGWTGILAEPAKCWHAALHSNRSSHIETRCVWRNSGDRILFNETPTAEFSTINSFSSNDWAGDLRKNGVQYEVETISLTDLLKKYDAPKIVDYLSIDTEGSELEILSHCDLEDFKFRVITCEHNNTSMRQNIYDLLTSHGYVRKFDDLSQFDDWYINRAI